MPARNEAERLPAFIRALSSQTWQRRTGRRLGVVLVLNNCNDGSAELIAFLTSAMDNLDVAAVNVWFDDDAAHAGSARRLAMETALARYGGEEPLALLTTDADSVPGPEWVDANLTALARNVDLVGGELLGDREEERELGSAFLERAAVHRKYRQLIDALALEIDPIAWDPAPRHQDHTGASLAVRGDVYHAVGGMRALAKREDLDFVSRVLAAGGRLRHDPSVRVVVSARTAGRAIGGMAECLRTWLRDEAEGRPLHVEAPEVTLHRLYLRRAIRSADMDRRGDRIALAARLGVAGTALCDAFGMPFGTGHLIELYAPDDPDAATTSVANAIRHLSGVLERRRVVEYG